MNKDKVLKRIEEILKIESEAVKALTIGNEYIVALKMLLDCRGRVVVTGMGKPGIIAQKISATMSSTGTPSLYLHPAEAVHGDLGRVTKDDVVIALSNSGETDEIKNLLPVIKRIGVKIISITGNVKSTLAQVSNVVINAKVDKEACPFNLAPTASTTVMLAIGDVLAITLLESKDFNQDDYALYHPAGVLGKKLLLKVEDVMRKGNNHPIVNIEDSVKNVLVEITKSHAGSATVVDSNGILKGIFTDGDLRRWLGKKGDILNREIESVMSKDPKRVELGSLAVEAGKTMQDFSIDELVVVDSDIRPVGLIDIQDLLKVGLV